MSWGGGDLLRDFVPGALVGGLLVLLLWQVMKPVQTFTVYDSAKVDSLVELNARRADTVGYLLDTIALLNYKDSVVRYRYGKHLKESKNRIDSITYWGREDVDAWLCKNYGYCK
jgi:hypothetical protein